ncbi:phosphatidylserine decarboxylase isoform X2 [Rhodnius prolixus]|uniref:phosphatidylserine decarboxylase isoform X2 n=1 Tax=Rhodnius prolixus TaxID=13249 RepID=UPI003D18BA1B
MVQEIKCYTRLPLRAMSRALGHMSRISLPTALRSPVYGTYARLFSVNTTEMARPMDDYACFAEFFVRALKEGVRPLDNEILVSPADGKLLNAGIVESTQLEQVKGVTYSIKKFLGGLDWKNSDSSDRDINFNQLSKPCTLDEFNGNHGEKDWDEYKKSLLHNKENELYQCVIYLGPGDYHRFHSPVDWKVNFRRHFNGELLSVNPSIASWLPGLFTLNERVVYFGTWEHGFFSFTAVGATNVGSIRIYDDKELKTNKKLSWINRSKVNKPDETHLDLSWSKGQLIGEFRLGSTIVMLLEGPKGLKFNVGCDQRVRVGKAISPNVNLNTNLS